MFTWQFIVVPVFWDSCYWLIITMPGKSRGAKQFMKIKEDIETRNRKIFGSGPTEQYVDHQRGIASGTPAKDLKCKWINIINLNLKLEYVEKGWSGRVWDWEVNKMIMKRNFYIFSSDFLASQTTFSILSKQSKFQQTNG